MIRRIFSGRPWEDVAGYARAVVADPWMLVEVDAYSEAVRDPRSPGGETA